MGKKVAERMGGSDVRNKSPLLIFNEDLEFLQVCVGGTTDACQLTRSKATRSAPV